MHAADAAGGEKADARVGRDDHRRGDGGCTWHTGGQIGREVAAAHLADAVGVAHPLQLFLIQADLHLAVEDGDRRGDAALIADDLLDLAAEVEVLRIGHAMAEDRGFQRNNGLTLGKRGLNFRGDGQIFFKIHSDIPPKSSG